MKVFAHILAENLHGQWFAWFFKRPQTGCSGFSKEEAVVKLFQLYGENDFDVNGLIELDERSDSGHRQLLVPHRRRVLIPSVSRN